MGKKRGGGWATPSSVLLLTVGAILHSAGKIRSTHPFLNYPPVTPCGHGPRPHHVACLGRFHIGPYPSVGLTWLPSMSLAGLPLTAARYERRTRNQGFSSM
jgi:hypothetical protein